MKSRVFPIAATLALLAASACAQTPPADQAPTDAVAPQAASPAPAIPAQTVSPDYIIGPGDTLQIFVWRNPELSAAIPVRPDGKVSTPLIEDMVAVGKTPTQLARDMEVQLSEYIRSPQVNVIVTTPLSAFSKITVIGQVGTPGDVPYREGMTVLDVVLAAGGLGEFAAGNRAKLVRKAADGKTTEKRVRLEDLVKKGKLKENIAVQPGDVLIVPESFF
jgi:polysaccharide export outer membrane protein